MSLPRALLLDLDDTILDSYSDPDEAWLHLCHEFACRVETVTAGELHAAVLSFRDRFWGDSERARQGRLHLREARREIVLRAFTCLNIPNSSIAGYMADRYTIIREEAVRPFPGSIDALRQLQNAGIRLGLITNGAARAQRDKIESFDLVELFEHIQIEGELGVGKPDERAFRLALDALGVEATEAWMVGDNLEFDIRGAQQAGIYAVWVDARGGGLPDGTTVRPDRIIGALSDLVD